MTALSWVYVVWNFSLLGIATYGTFVKDDNWGWFVLLLFCCDPRGK